MNWLRVGLLSGVFLSAGFSAFAEDTLSEQIDELVTRLREVPAPVHGGREAEAIARQLVVIQRALDRGEYEVAEQAMRSLSTQTIPGVDAETWQNLIDTLAVTITEGRQRQATEWLASVDTLVENVRAACITAETTADLDLVMVETASLQTRRSQQSGNILTERANQKLQSAASALTAWSRMLDATEMGSLQDANNALRGMLSSGQHIPIIPREEIERRIVSESVTAPKTFDQVVASALREVTGPDDIPEAIAVIEREGAKVQQNSQNISMVTNRLEAVKNLHDALQKGDIAAAEAEEARLRHLPRAMNLGSGDRVESLQRESSVALLMVRLTRLSGVEPTEEETPEGYIERVTSTLREREQYAELARFLTDAQRLQMTANPQNPGVHIGRDAAALTAYGNAIRFERAGDVLPAIAEYRNAIRMSAGSSLVPVDEAEKALARLTAEHPEAANDMSGVLLDEIRQLRREVQMISRGGAGRPPFSQ